VSVSREIARSRGLGEFVVLCEWGRGDPNPPPTSNNPGSRAFPGVKKWQKSSSEAMKESISIDKFDTLDYSKQFDSKCVYIY